MKPKLAEPFSRIAVTGPDGQVGYRILADIRRRWPKAALLPLPRSEFDLSRPETLSRVLDEMCPSLILHAGAYTQVDLAESETELCTRVNRDATAAIGEWCLGNQVPLVFFSTDYVFSGDTDFPCTPASPRKPVNHYGRTKAEAEAALEDLSLRRPGESFPCLILRTQWVYDSRGKNFLRTMLSLLADRPSVTVVDDQVGSPTYAKDLAEAALDLTSAWLHEKKPGIRIRHVTNSGFTTWFHFAKAIREGAIRRGILEPHGELLPIRSVDFPTKAVRPMRSALDLKETLQERVHPRSWEIALEECLDEYARMTQGSAANPKPEQETK